MVYLKNSHGAGVADSSLSVGSYWYALSATGIPDSIVSTNATTATGGVYVPDVHVYPGDDLAGLADSSPVGTVFMVHGVHSGQSVEPRDGQVFVSAGDGVLDGEGRVEFAFSGDADDVVISGLEIVDYGTPTQFGSVYVSGSGWLVEGNEAVSYTHLRAHET